MLKFGQLRCCFVYSPQYNHPCSFLSSALMLGTTWFWSQTFDVLPSRGLQQSFAISSFFRHRMNAISSLESKKKIDIFFRILEVQGFQFSKIGILLCVFRLITCQFRMKVNLQRGYKLQSEPFGIVVHSLWSLQLWISYQLFSLVGMAFVPLIV